MAALLINGRDNIIDSQTGTVNAIVDVMTTTVTDLTYKNNIITAVNTAGHILNAGGEGPDASYDNKLDGSTISGNKITWNGDMAGGFITHGLFIGYAKNFNIRYNYLDKTPYGILPKSGSVTTGNMTYTSGGIAYNIVKNCKMSANSKGMNGVCYYNNTFVTDQSYLQGRHIWIGGNPSTNNVSPTGIRIKNNIFYSQHRWQFMIDIDNSATLSDFQSDYNVFWCVDTGNGPQFRVGGTEYNFAQWQALGYDTHSVVANPNFIDFTNFVPTARLNYGTDLGATWQNGLSTSAVWSLGNDPALTTQNGTWQVGARVYAGSAFAPIVTTTAISSITNTTATSGGNVTSDGGASVTARGVCWSTSANPTTANSTTSNGTGTGSFISNLTGLTLNTTYHVRAYATNSVGTSYGTDVPFTTTGGTGTSYYIAPNGSDTTGNGTIGSPWFTINKAWPSLVAGATLYLRGGTYNYASTQILAGKNGTSINPINVFAYPGEVPIITKTVGSFNYMGYQCAINFRGNYFHWDGITVTGFPQPDGGLYNNMIVEMANNNIFERMVFSYGTIGFDINWQSDNNIMLNCDFHHNKDPNSADSYGNADGANAHTDYGTTNTFRGCRFWSNSDDGIDLFNGNGLILIDNCWSFWNGFKDGVYIDDVNSPMQANDGEGFKLGSTTDYSTIHLRTLTNCLSFQNRLGGIDYNDSKCIIWLYNNTSYHNNVGNEYQFGLNVGDGRAHIVRNNIVWDTQNTSGLEVATSGTVDHNSWESNGHNTKVTSADFLSINSTGVDGPRLSDGSLPSLNFLKLAAGSDMINVGVNVGLPYNGAAPDLGAYEFGGSNPVLPTVITSSVPSIGSTSAVVNGNITSDGGATITARGFCWGININPTLSNSFINNGTGTGTFSNTISGLSPGTIYHVRAYGTNSVGTSYGADIQFVTTTPVVLPTVTTQAVTAISYVSATANGNMTNNGGDSNAIKGICWASHTVPTLSDNVGGNTTGSGAFTIGLSGANPSTIYYVRAFAINSAGTVYGNEVQFTTLSASAPTVTTTAITNIAQSTATSGGGVTNINGASVTATGVCWSTTSSPTIAGSKTTDGTTLSWVSSITGLTFDTLYYVRAYATNSAGTGYGNQVSFTTGAAIPTLFINAVSSITSTTALSGGNTLSDNGSAISVKGVCWGTSTNPTIANSYTTDGSGVSNFISNISGLAANTTYYIRAYATNSIGTAYSSNVQFTTLDIPGSTWLEVIKAKVHKWFCDNTAIPPALGPELIDQVGWCAVSLHEPTGWWDNSGGTGFTGDGVKLCSNPGYSYPLEKMGLLIPGNRYRVVIELDWISGWVEIWDGTGNHDFTMSASGVYEFDFIADDPLGSLWLDSSIFDGCILSFSVKEILGTYSLGAEELINGDFLDNSEWAIFDEGFSIVHPSNKLVNTGNNISCSNNSCLGKMIIGRTYSISYDVIDYVSGTGIVYFGASFGMTEIQANGTITRLFVYRGGDTNVYVHGSGVCNWAVTNITVKIIL
jgi:hypothetical protein